MPMLWSKDMDALLIEMWGKGKSVSDIGIAINKKFGGNLSRNSIVGRAHRLQQKGIIRKRKNPVVKKVKIEPAPKAVPEARIIVDVGDNGCKWPIAEIAGTRTHIFCGDRRKIGKPYCERHCELSYQKPESKKEKQHGDAR